ncbi:carboxypeptidase-like regulatory domain-containing protein [Algibacter aquimarinus]|uniref:Peptidase M56 domain-containing protein n=1 Tax=Algibacter aquimarinus TaxID=1136748 RepID=A0ABP9H335_9FLAO
MEYLFKVSFVVVIFYFSYKLFLQRDTFFEQNRWFLLVGLITAFIVPSIVIPNYIEYVPIELPVEEYNYVAVTNEKTPFNISDYLPFIYGIGVLCFLVRFFIQLTSLGSVIYKNKREKHGNYTYVKTSQNIAPFSFFNWIVYNPNDFNSIELNQIITHEKIHVQDYHSVDILITQLSCILLWFNPFIWFYNKDLKQNLEFIADHKAQNKISCKKTYQTTLLKTSLPSHQMVLSTNFYNSLIKKRIVMLHKSKSKKINLIKYTVVIPLVALFLMSFNVKDIYIEKEVPKPFKIEDRFNKNNLDLLLEENEPELLLEENKVVSKTNKTTPIEIKETNDKKINSAVIQEKTEVTLNKNTTDASLDKIKASLKEKGIDAKFKNIKRNSNGEITAIKINVSSKKANANYNVSSDNAIKPIIILINDNNISIGNKSTNNNVKEFIITGKVSDNEGEYLPGTTITIKNTNKGAITDFDGNYKIKTKEGDVLTFSYVGFDSKAIEVKAEEDINVILNEREGKGGKYKAVITRATTGDSSKVVIKTDNGKEPIYVINGKVLSKEEMEEIHPDLIKSVTVLKGEKATSIYGTEGENGVVIIEKKNDNKITIGLNNDDSDDEEIIVITEEEGDSNRFIMRSSGSNNKTKPLFIIDGKESKDDIEDLDPNNIEKINVIKGKKATEKYGDKGKNGVIEIITKKK